MFPVICIILKTIYTEVEMYLYEQKRNILQMLLLYYTCIKVKTFII